MYLLHTDSPITNSQKYLSTKVLALDSGNLSSNPSDCVAVGKSCLFDVRFSASVKWRRKLYLQEESGGTIRQYF